MSGVEPLWNEANIFRAIGWMGEENAKKAAVFGTAALMSKI
jgi:hypothetical protein